MKEFKHVNATTVEEAASALKEYEGRAKVTAGGTDLLGEMKDEILPCPQRDANRQTHE